CPSRREIRALGDRTCEPQLPPLTIQDRPPHLPSARECPRRGRREAVPTEAPLRTGSEEQAPKWILLEAPAQPHSPSSQRRGEVAPRRYRYCTSPSSVAFRSRDRDRPEPRALGFPAPGPQNPACP